MPIHAATQARVSVHEPLPLGQRTVEPSLAANANRWDLGRSYPSPLGLERDARSAKMEAEASHRLPKLAFTTSIEGGWVRGARPIRVRHEAADPAQHPEVCVEPKQRHHGCARSRRP